MVDFLIIIVIIASLVLLGVALYPKISEKLVSKKTIIESFEQLQTIIQHKINNYVSFNSLGLGLSEEEIDKQLRLRENIRTNIQLAPSGDIGAREAMKAFIIDKMNELKMTDEDIDNIISFSPETGDSFTQFETLMYLYSTKHEMMDGTEFADFMRAVLEKHPNERTITDEMLSEVLKEEYTILEYQQKIDILAQLIFANLYGLGVIDTINFQNEGIEEIQVGMNGMYTTMYDYRKAFTDSPEQDNLSRNGVYVIFKGKNYFLSFLRFHSNADMIRVLRNLCLNVGAGDLTEKHPNIQSDTIDGRRINVARPPFTDSYVGFIRKFSGNSIINIKSLYPDDLICGTLERLVASGINIAFTGEMETGKTTLLRAGLTLLSTKQAIRIVESGTFELNGRKYLPHHNVTSIKIADEMDEQKALAFCRKTSGTVFVVGEVTNDDMANLCNNISKIASQMFYSAHFPSTQQMISGFTDARLKNGGTMEDAARREILTGMGFDVHVCNQHGKRFIEAINEIISFGDGNYKIVPVLHYDLENSEYVPDHKPSDRTYDNAKRVLSPEKYKAFCNFFDTYYGTKVRTSDAAKGIKNPELPSEPVVEKAPAWISNISEGVSSTFQY